MVQLPLFMRRDMVAGLQRWGRAASTEQDQPHLPSGQSSVLSHSPALLFHLGLLLPCSVWPSPRKGFGSWQVISTSSVTSMTNASSPFFSLFHCLFPSPAGIVQIILALTAKPR